MRKPKEHWKRVKTRIGKVWKRINKGVRYPKRSYGVDISDKLKQPDLILPRNMPSWYYDAVHEGVKPDYDMLRDAGVTPDKSAQMLRQYNLQEQLRASAGMKTQTEKYDPVLHGPISISYQIPESRKGPVQSQVRLEQTRQEQIKALTTPKPGYEHMSLEQAEQIVYGEPKKSYYNYPQRIHILSNEIDRAPEGSLTRFFKADEIKRLKDEQREKIKEARL